MRAACLVAVGALAAAGLALTDLPASIVPVAGVGLLGWSLWRAFRDLRAVPGTLVLRGDGSGATWVGPDGEVDLADLTVRWRGPLASVVGRDPAGKLRTLAWWPDTLPGSARRSLRLASGRPACPRVPPLST